MDLNAYFLLYDTNPERRREKKKMFEINPESIEKYMS